MAADTLLLVVSHTLTNISVCLRSLLLNRQSAVFRNVSIAHLYLCDSTQFSFCQFYQAVDDIFRRLKISEAIFNTYGHMFVHIRSRMASPFLEQNFLPQVSFYLSVRFWRAGQLWFILSNVSLSFVLSRPYPFFSGPFPISLNILCTFCPFYTHPKACTHGNRPSGHSVPPVHPRYHFCIVPPLFWVYSHSCKWTQFQHIYFSYWFSAQILHAFY